MVPMPEVNSQRDGVFGSGKRKYSLELITTGFRIDVFPLIRLPVGLMEPINASLQRGR